MSGCDKHHKIVHHAAKIQLEPRVRHGIAVIAQHATVPVQIEISWESERRLYAFVRSLQRNLIRYELVTYVHQQCNRAQRRNMKQQTPRSHNSRDHTIM